MLDIILPDGSKKSVESMSVIEFAKTISTSLAKKNCWCNIQWSSSRCKLYNK